MTDCRQCDWERCTSQAGPFHFVHGSAYCPEHYLPALEKYFFKEFEEWDPKEDPSRKFLDLLSRYVEAICHEKNLPVPGGLSKVKFDHRVFEVKKTKTGIEFGIERLPYYWPTPYSMEKVKEHWRLNVKRKTLKLLKTE